MVAPEAQLYRGGVGVKVGALADGVGLDASPPRRLPPQVSARHALNHQRVVAPPRDERTRHAAAPARLQLDGGGDLGGARGLGGGRLRVERRFDLRRPRDAQRPVPHGDVRLRWHGRPARCCLSALLTLTDTHGNSRQARGEVGGGFSTRPALAALSRPLSQQLRSQPSNQTNEGRSYGCWAPVTPFGWRSSPAPWRPRTPCRRRRARTTTWQHLSSSPRRHRRRTCRRRSSTTTTARSSIGSCTCCTSNISSSSSSSSSRRRHSSVRYSSPFCGCSRHSCRRVSQRPLDPRSPLPPPPPTT